MIKLNQIQHYCFIVLWRRVITVWFSFSLWWSFRTAKCLDVLCSFSLAASKILNVLSLRIFHFIMRYKLGPTKGKQTDEVSTISHIITVMYLWPILQDEMHNMSGVDLEEPWNPLIVKECVVCHLFYDNTSNGCNCSNSKSHIHLLEFFIGSIYNNGILQILQIIRLDFTKHESTPVCYHVSLHDILCWLFGCIAIHISS